jgi:hypothetical protein
MPQSLVKLLNLRGNPFEHYTAETEPDIASYAVRPPYLQAISDRVHGLSSFILFGDRGAGKSATRITVYNEVWNEISTSAKGERGPLVVNVTDFSAIQDIFKKDKLADRDIVGIVAFAVIEQVIVWLSSLKEADRDVYINGLDASERTLILALIKGFYLSVSEANRMVSTDDALRLINAAWVTKGAVWASQHWQSLSKVFAAVVNALSKKTIDSTTDISAPAEELLKSLIGDTPNVSRAILSKLVEMVRLLPFSGVAVLIDKVDETPATAKSAEATAKLIYPLLAHVQLLEVNGFSWVMFLWSKVKDHFNGEKLPVRLDKLAHANIEWDASSLREMLEARIRFYSEGKMKFRDIFESNVDVEGTFASLISLAISSPRELIKLMDTIFREHDALSSEPPTLLNAKSLEIGQDKYVTETIEGFFPAKLLEQVFRLGRVTFVNKDVQSAFKIGDQSARVKIKNWEDAGLVRQSGTQAPSSELGGQPAYKFVISDARVERIINRKLVDTVGAGAEAEEN